MLWKSDTITDASGSVGGVTFGKNAAGLFTRSRIKPRIATSEQWRKVVSAFSSLQGRWRLLSQSQRDAWSLYAANTSWTFPGGSVGNLTGLQMFTHCNVARLQAALPRVSDGPTTFGIPAGAAITLAATESDATVEVSFDGNAAWCAEDGAALLVSVSRQYQPTVANWQDGYRFIAAIAGDSTTPPTSPATVPANGALNESNFTQAVARVTRADGRISGFTADVAVIGPPPPTPVSGIWAAGTASFQLAYDADFVLFLGDATGWSFVVDSTPYAVFGFAAEGANVNVDLAAFPGSGSIATCSYDGSNPGFVTTSGQQAGAFLDFPLTIV